MPEEKEPESLHDRVKVPVGSCEGEAQGEFYED